MDRIDPDACALDNASDALTVSGVDDAHVVRTVHPRPRCPAARTRRVAPRRFEACNEFANLFAPLVRRRGPA
jgi:hypothetical protein